MRDAQISGTELHHKLFLQRKLAESFTGLSGYVVCIQVEDGVGLVGIWRFGVLFGFYGERKKQLVSDNFFEVGYSMLPPFHFNA